MATSSTVRPLTAKQVRFCAEYLVDLNATAASRRAGYSAKTAEQIGYQLLQLSSVQSRIAELQVEIVERTKITVDGVVAQLEKLRDQAIATKQMGPAVRAQELIGRTVGAFVDRVATETSSVDDETLAKRLAGGDADKAKIIRSIIGSRDQFRTD